MASENALQEVVSARREQEYIDQGLQPHEIGIILTSEGIYGHYYNNLKTSLFQNSNLAMTTPISQTIFGRWFGGYLKLFEDADLAQYFDWLKNPVTGNWLESQDIDYCLLTVGGIDQRIASIDEISKLEDLPENFAQNLKELLHFFPNEEKSLLDWLDVLNGFLECFAWQDH